MGFSSLVADEDRAARNWERLKETYPDFPWKDLKESNKRLLDLLLGFSYYAANLLVRQRDLLELFLLDPFPRPKGTKALEREIVREGLSFKDRRSFGLFLRRIKQREIVKILTRDLAGEKFSLTVLPLPL